MALPLWADAGDDAAVVGLIGEERVVERIGFERDLRLYGWLALCVRAYFWLPTAVLFFVERFGLRRALVLAAVYSIGVVVAEVPTGWFSDHVGRVPTLRISAACWTVAFSLFVAGSGSYLAVALAQLLLAFGGAFLSGTDVSYHYDLLEAAGTTDRFAVRQARITRNGFAVSSAAALVGGAIGAIDLRLPFLASLLVAVVYLAITLRLGEPHAPRSAPPFRRQLGECLHYLRRPLLAWLFAYVAAQVVLEHLPLDLAQPYLTEALGHAFGQVGDTPVYAGALFAVVAAVGSVAASISVGLGRRLGLVGALLLIAALQVGIQVAMALSMSAAVAALLTLRSVQTAAGPVLVNAAVAPLLQRHHRATYLSIGNLAGRLGYVAVVLGLSLSADLHLVLRTAAGISAVLFVSLALTGRTRSVGNGEDVHPAALR